MAANSGDLVQNLIKGGLAPQAATLIANAIANAGTPQLAQARDSTDSTPVDQLRLITPDVRRYQLTNLDYSPSRPFQQRLETVANKYTEENTDHPYKDSQPVVAAAPLANPRVQAGDYIKVENGLDGDAQVSTITLRLRTKPGSHLRIDPSTGSIDGVPLTVKTEAKFLSAEFVERDEATELVISLRGLEKKEVRLADNKSQYFWGWPTGQPEEPSRLFTPAGVLHAWCYFNPAAKPDLTPASDGMNIYIDSGLHISSVYRYGQGRYRVTMSRATPGIKYHVAVTCWSETTRSVVGVVRTNADGLGLSQPTTTQFGFSTVGDNDAHVLVDGTIAVFA